MKRVSVVLALVLVASTVSTAHAGPLTTSFDRVSSMLGVGDRVTVRPVSGSHIAGTVVGVSASSLVLSVRGQLVTLRGNEIQRLSRRRRDRVGDGALKGIVGAAPVALIGAGFVAAAPKSEGGGRVNATKVVVLYTGIGAAIGTAIDAVIVKREVVYERAHP